MKSSDLIYVELKTVDKLDFDGRKFNLWRRKLNFLLLNWSIGYVMTDPQPPVPKTGSPPESNYSFNKWLYDDSQCRQIILDTVDHCLSLILSQLPTSKSYMDTLEARFKKTPAQIVELLRSYLGRRMGKMDGEQCPIDGHIDAMGRAAFDLEMAGFTVPEEIKIEVLKDSLPATWRGAVEGMILGMDKKDPTYDTVIERFRSVGRNKEALDIIRKKENEMNNTKMACFLIVFSALAFTIIWSTSR